MRLMMKFTIPVEKGNEAESNGTMSQAIADLLETVNAEAAYFALEHGKRMGIVIFEETDPARMPVINEPLFAALNASIEIQPVISVEGLQRAL